jgi:MFS transporter, BCD family, chlorophyll transporter
MNAASLGWLGIIRLGLVQTALGAVIVLTTSTINRVMTVELALPAMLPGALVAWHYALQILRPRWGHGSDNGRRATPIIVAGMAILAFGGALSAVGTAAMAGSFGLGLALSILAFTLIGFGVGAAGTSLLVLLAKSVAGERRIAAATIVWLMMIAGFAITAKAAGYFLEPFSMARLVTVTSAVSLIAFAIAILAVLGVEKQGVLPSAFARMSPPKTPFREALAEVWADPKARLFSIFVFVSMLGYSAQDLILEPFAGIAFGLSAGQTTSLSGSHHGGVFFGMVSVALVSSFGRDRFGSPKAWTIAGCIASAIALMGLIAGASGGSAWPIGANVAALGAANGVYAASAIGAMMALSHEGGAARAGTRMGVWGAAQAIAMGIGGSAGAAAADILRWLGGAPVTAYSTVFMVEAVLFIAAAALAVKVAAFGGFRRASDIAPTEAALELASGRG